jgi:hypothetical protein
VEVGLGLFAGPALGVNAGIDDQTSGAPGLIAQHAEGVVGRVVHAHFGAEALAVERPSFAVRGDVDVAEFGEVFVGLDHLLRDRELQRVAGGGLVQRERGQ